METAALTSRYKTYLASVLDTLPAEMPFEEKKARLLSELDAAVKADLEARSGAYVSDIREGYAALGKELESIRGEAEGSELDQVRNLLGSLPAEPAPAAQ